MSLINGSVLSKSYGADTIFSGVSIHVPHQARIGLVGPNGVGKSTLLRVLARLEDADEGTLQWARELSIGHLPQEVEHSRRPEQWLTSSLWQLALGAFSELRGMEAELRQLENLMADPNKTASAMSRYGELQETFELAGGYDYLAEAQRVLRGLGFAEDEFGRELLSFSGGERTRALLARLLLEDPDVLVLDEPTNHLDIESVSWLESWLSAWPGAVIVVSHDRYFLDQVVESVWDLTADGLKTYRGGYSEFARQKRESLARRRKVYSQQQERIAKEKEFIRRNLAGQNTRQAQGRRTRLQRFLEDEAIKEEVDPGGAAISFEAAAQTGDWALRTRSLTIGRQGQSLFRVPDLELARGKRVAILGPNGVGKSTLLQTLTGRLPPLSGETQLGPNVKPGYFAQAHSDLEAERTVLDSLFDVRPDLKISQARGYLGRYLFSGEQVEKRVASLSGGERGRLALARLAAIGANLLLLDEPTNHLDLGSQEVLQAALEAFEGTVILVSHDRYLVQALATEIWALYPEGEQMELIRGGYEAYWQWRSGLQESRPVSSERKASPSRALPTGGASLRRQLESVEAEVGALEEKLSRIAAEIENTREDRDRVRKLGERYAEVEGRLKRKLAEWEGLSRQLEGA